DRDEEKPAKRSCVSHLQKTKRVIEKVISVEKCRIDRPASRHDEGLCENLQRADEAHDEIEENVGREERESDMPEAVPWSCAVQSSRFIIRRANRFETGQQDNNPAARAPKAHQNQRRLACLLVLQPIGTVNAEGGEHIIQQADVWIKDPDPQN